MDKRKLSKIKSHTNPHIKVSKKYIITASLENVDDEEILFVSLFNQKKIKEIADFKIYISKHDYISQKLQNYEYKWSKACIENLNGYYEWYNLSQAVCDRLEDKLAIEKFFDKECVAPSDAYNRIYCFQRKIMDERLEIKHKLIENKIDEVMKNVTQLPSDFDEWVYNDPFAFSKYIYYKRNKKKIHMFCTECRQDFTIEENQLTKQNIRHNNHGTCPKCNQDIMYKASGKTKNLIDFADFSIIQKYENNIIVRYFHGYKDYRTNYKKPVMKYYERIRDIYFFSNNKLKIDRYEYGYFMQAGCTRWCNNTGRFSEPETYVYSKNLNLVLKNTKWQYSCLNEFLKRINSIYVSTFLEEYVSHPQIEYIIKLKLFNFLNDKLFGSCYPTWNGVNFKGKNIEELLGIEKWLLRKAQKLNLNCNELELMKYCRNKDLYLSEEELLWISRNINLSENLYAVKGIFAHVTPTKAINYVKRQANEKYCLDSVIIDWYDYIGQCKSLKFDLEDSFILYPKNLLKRHEEYSILNKAKNFEKYDKGIKQAYQKLNEIYSYSDKQLSIRAANSVNEIVQEGFRQRHCVGGTTYISGMAKGKLAIMLLRKNNSLKDSYYTIELNLSTLNIVQCRGYKNCDPSQDVKKFLNEWKQAKLNTNKMKRAI